ncbi:hypothetical protein [Halorussus sp. AFM4]|uniref:hypothetical protein n=1 Tax=Halorussus sp. AFM4 TaxID=3421651 RepID=UPI003EC03C03
MFGDVIATLLKALIFGVIGVVFGGIVFESGKRYVKVGGNNEFAGKLAALPFFFAIICFGWFIQHAEQFLGAPIESAVYAIPSATRLGSILVLTMATFNYSVPDFNYFDWKSLIVYGLGLLFIFYPMYTPSIPI